tara:strand:- start:641 stop:1084 length:444 start_codon:yes stop_codon:yes gene_type:complete
MKKLLITCLFLIISCGYKPIYVKNDQAVLQFNKIISNGDVKINKLIINNSGLKENSTNDRDLTISSSYEIEETSKNTKGQVDTFRSVINIQLKIEKNGKILKRKNFSNSSSYNNKDSKFDLIKIQNQIKDNLINELSGEIILFLNLK